ncbi:MAG: hypothetical protein WDN04_26355 [Rhodospirillales bacterium]
MTIVPSTDRRITIAIVVASFAASLGIGMLIPAVPLLTKGLPAVAHGALVSRSGWQGCYSRCHPAWPSTASAPASRRWSDWDC